MSIAWTVEAAAELDDILAYIASESPQAASLVAGRVLHTEKVIEQFPKAGRYDAETDSFDRFIPRTRIVLTYAIRGDTIWIITVWHTSRDPGAKPRRTHG